MITRTKEYIFVNITNIDLIIKQKPSKSSMANFKQASSSKIVIKQYRVRVFLRQCFFEQLKFEFCRAVKFSRYHVTCNFF